MRALRRRGAKYVLQTDIAQFYHSIYTHAVPWALHTKQFAKANKGKTPGDKIDTALRRQQSGQTIGIPIGPDASLLIAELLLSVVDGQLTSRHKNLSGFRYVDDYEFYCDSLQEAEELLQTIEAQLANYELFLNSRKTSIRPLPLPLDDRWFVELSQTHVDNGRGDIALLNDLIELFSRAFDLAAENPDAPILKYILTRTSFYNLGTKHWRTVEGLLSSAIAAEPFAIPACVSLISKARASGQKMSSHILGATIESIIQRAAKVGHAGEAAWGIWCAMAAELRLGAEVSKAISPLEDDVVALLAMHAARTGILPKGSLDLSRWQALVDLPDAFHGEHWLMAYEGLRKKWLVSKHHPGANIAPLQMAQVSFYDTATSAKTIPSSARALPGGTLSFGYF